MVTDTTIVEILLAVLAVAIGVGSFLGATRANKAQSDVAIINIDAQAYERAQQIYESAISTLEKRVTSQEKQMEIMQTQIEDLSVEITRLHRENSELRNRK